MHGIIFTPNRGAFRQSAGCGIKEEVLTRDAEKRKFFPTKASVSLVSAECNVVILED